MGRVARAKHIPDDDDTLRSSDHLRLSALEQAHHAILPDAEAVAPSLEDAYAYLLASAGGV